MALQKLANEQGYLKAGFLGFPKSGKTYTSVKLAIGTIKLFKLDGPVALFDTESGSNYVADLVKTETGKDLLGVRARSFDALMQFARDCITEKVSVAIIDSISHPWSELMESYLSQLNEKRKSKGWQPLAKLEFQNWSSIKGIWEQWPTFFLNSPLHIIVCGRAGFTFEMEKDEETGRKELVKTGIKMRVESNFGFEPSLLVEMEREQIDDGDGGFKIVHRATILGDRFAVSDGATAVNPGFEFFAPHVQRLRPGTHSVVTINKSETGADVEGNVNWDREKQQRTIYCEEIQGEIVAKFPGQSAQDKKEKGDLLLTIFGTRSWTKVESMQSYQLKEGLDRLRKHLGVTPQEQEDDLPFGPETPKTPQDAPGGITTAPATETPAVALSEEARLLLLKVRTLIQTPGGLTEEGLLKLLAALGSITDQDRTLEVVAMRRPELLNTVSNNWDTYVAAAKEWK